MTSEQVDAESGSHIDQKISHATRRVPFFALLFLVYFGVAVVLQWLTGTYAAEFGHFTDEPGHVVSALMIRDYLLSGFHQSPIEYAKIYYVHYPKVCLGVWPPMFHTSAALWMILLKPSHGMLLLFMGMQTAVLATILAVFAGRLFGRQVGTGLGFLLLCLPLIVWGGSVVMLDVFMTMVQFCAIWFLVKFFQTERVRFALLFGLFTSMAMLTKGNSNAMVLVPIFMMVLLSQFRILKLRGLYASAAIIVIVGLPWQLLSWRLVRDSVPISHVTPSYVFHTGLTYIWWLLAAVGPVIAVVSMVGAAIECRKIRQKAGSQQVEMAAIISWMASVLLFHAIAPVPSDFRYITPALPGMLILFAAGVRWLAPHIPPTSVSITSRAVGLAGVAVLVFAAVTFKLPLRPQLGFAEAARVISAPVRQDDTILICSDANGEGAFISEVAFLDRRPGRIVLRGTKVLSENTWSYDPTKPSRQLFHNTAEEQKYLDAVAVTTIVVDTTPGLVVGNPQDRILLMEMLQKNSSDWKLIHEIRSPSHLLIYRRGKPLPDSRAREERRIRMPYTLGQDLVLK